MFCCRSPSNSVGSAAAVGGGRGAAIWAAVRGEESLLGKSPLKQTRNYLDKKSNEFLEPPFGGATNWNHQNSSNSMFGIILR